MFVGRLGGDTIQLTFLGEATTVSGSSYLLESNGHKVLVDCGLFQGVKTIEALNHRPFPYNPAELDSVLLTHAHIHHSGLLPKLIKEGFKKNIYVTKATAELCYLLLPSYAHNREFATQTTNRRSRPAEIMPVQPLYTVDDAQACLKYFLPVEYNGDVELPTGIRVRFQAAGRILGASILEIWVAEQGRTTKLVFSGSYGQPGQPTINDPGDADQLTIVFTATAAMRT